MSLYQEWLKVAYNEKGESKQKTWDIYLPLEQKIYEDMLTNKTNQISGTVKELSARFHMNPEFVCGFIDGINEAIKTPLDIEELKEEDYVTLEIDFEVLYKKMVEYKADHLYDLPEWENVFTEEELKEFYRDQKVSKTVIRGQEKIGRNDPCTCGSGKKYKKCCGLK